MTPDDFPPNTPDFRPPMPYRRIKPEYTRTAYLYSVEGTVDLEVDVDDNGKIVHIDVVRWLGFGLDEAAVKAVTDMNWRPAESKGKRLAMRVLLRYNFKKIEKD
jgi:protein TonB